MSTSIFPASRAVARPVGARAFDWRRHLKEWWSETDRLLVVLVLLLMLIGTLAVAAASPASAARLSDESTRLADSHFLWLHLRVLIPGIIVMLAIAMLGGELARKLAIALCGAMLVAMLLVPVFGNEVNGSRRWLDLGLSLQPSEFLKPAFAVVMAWVIALRQRDPDLPVVAFSTGLMGLIVLLLALQPNFGEAMLFIGVWLVLLVLGGLPLARFGRILGLVSGMVVLWLALYENGRERIFSFLSGSDAYSQVDLAWRTLLAGGWFGTGFRLGSKKMSLPEAHTDYIFSVIGEEFGLFWCWVLVLVYVAVAVRVLWRLLDEDRLFVVLAGSGLATLFTGQAFINILVNLHWFPSKGMTLPLVSYGGSSTLAQCMAMGLLLAITRRNPYLTRERFDLRDLLGRGRAND